jgi:hypothetical protein
MIDQIFIGLFGVTAIYLANHPLERVRRWGCISGLCAQPFWFWTTAMHGQWVIFGLSIFYTLGWLRGVRTYWLRRPA